MQNMTRKPTHPGQIIKEDYLIPLSISIKEISKQLSISSNELSEIINEKSSITPEIALRLSMAFDTTPDFWMNLQKNYDLWSAMNASISWKLVKPLSYNLLHST